MTEAAETYDVPISVLRRRIEDELVTDEGQGVGTALSKESECKKDQKTITESNVVEKWVELY